MIRTFHPIGQGAFYSERHQLNGVGFTIVYDCGSSTIKGKKFETMIENYLHKGQTIDVLFISHFHADHINGIKFLLKHNKIKKVVLPLLDDAAKVLLKVTNLIEYNFSDTMLIDNPERFFGGDTIIITILPTENNSNTDGIELEAPTYISEITKSYSTSSGTVFKIKVLNDWLFIPFNYEFKKREAQFLKALYLLGLSITDIDTAQKIKTHKENIRKAYMKVKGKLNKNSMILYSGKDKDDFMECIQHNYFLCLHKCLQSGCLYTGDIDLNEPNIVQNINSKLKNVLPFIGTIQIPHHGSINNFSPLILQRQCRCAIFSFGTTNKYGHPSVKVIGDVLAHHAYPHLVTEVKSTIVNQIG